MMCAGTPGPTKLLSNYTRGKRRRLKVKSSIVLLSANFPLRLTVWHVAEKESRWFSPSDSSFMINYRVDNLSEMIAELRRGGVEVIGGPESHENGKFAWIMDPEGNKVELWEPMIWNEKNKSV
jgi:hypothetical protein